MLPAWAFSASATSSLTSVLKATAPTPIATATPGAAASASASASHKSAGATTTTTTKAALWPRPGFVDSYCAAVELFPVKCGNCSLSLCTGRHFYKCESLRAARIAITNNGNLLHLAVGFKHFAQRRFVLFIREITYIYPQSLLLSLT